MGHPPLKPCLIHMHKIFNLCQPAHAQSALADMDKWLQLIRN